MGWERREKTYLRISRDHFSLHDNRESEGGSNRDYLEGKANKIGRGKEKRSQGEVKKIKEKKRVRLKDPSLGGKRGLKKSKKGRKSRVK